MRADIVIVCAGELSVAAGIKSYLLRRGKTLVFVALRGGIPVRGPGRIIEPSLCCSFSLEGKALTFIFLSERYG